MKKNMFKRFKDKPKFDVDDELVNQCSRKFKIQSEDMKSLVKNFDAFVNEIKSLTNIIENLYLCFRKIYEPDWHGNFEFHQSCQNSLKCWQGFIEEFKTFQLEFENYQGTFPEMKKSIEKCRKRASEFQKQKHALESLRNTKKTDNTKLTKVGLELKNAKSQYDDISKELRTTLPEFYDKRIPTYIQLWSSLFHAENILYQSLLDERMKQLTILTQLNETAKTEKYSIKNQVNISEKQNNLYDKTKATSVVSLFHSDRRTPDPKLVSSISVWHLASETVYDQIDAHGKDNSTLSRVQSFQNGTNINDGDSQTNKKIYVTNTPSPQQNYPKSPRRSSSISNSDIEDDYVYSKVHSASFNDSPKLKQLKTRVPSHKGYSVTVRTSNLYETIPSDSNRKSPRRSSSANTSDYEGDYVYSKIQRNVAAQESPKSNQFNAKNPISERHSVSANSSDFNEIIPHPFIKKVIAKYNYGSQDDDELSLQKDDIILVIPWENEDQMEVGWLYGENEKTKKKGLFPENHTQPLN